jgi:hypothetical protein
MNDGVQSPVVVMVKGGAGQKGVGPDSEPEGVIAGKRDIDENADNRENDQSKRTQEPETHCTSPVPESADLARECAGLGDVPIFPRKQFQLKHTFGLAFSTSACASGTSSNIPVTTPDQTYPFYDFTPP